jgi:hypothetical protein
MPRPQKNPSGGKNKNDLKTTVIIVLFCLAAAQAFLFFHAGKQGALVAVKAAAGQAKMVKPKIVPKAVPGSAGKIAFIIDDWGYTMHNCKFLKEIAAPLAVAVLPNLRNTDNIMKCANVYGKDIMLHLPLEPYANRDRYPDNYVITTAMKPSKVNQIVDDTLAKMPLAQGVNNHMGSRATEDKELMKVIFKRLKKKGLFFVDSMTAPHHSICGELAREMDMPFTSRDVFLDNINTAEAIKKQIVDLAKKARKKGYAVAIGHDRALTMQVLKEEIRTLEDQGFEIVRVKTLLKNQ